VGLWEVDCEKWWGDIEVFGRDVRHPHPSIEVFEEKVAESISLISRR